jgi:hypothetical protein
LGNREGVAVGLLEVGGLGVALKSCDAILGGLQTRLVEVRSEREGTDEGVQVAFGEWTKNHATSVIPRANMATNRNATT